MIDTRAAFASLHEPGAVAAEKRDWFTEGKNPPWWGYSTEAGVAVSEDGALRLATAWACIRLLSETVATLPAIIYRELSDGRERASTHPMYSLLHDKPNPNTPAVPYYETLMLHLLLYGNAYSYVDRPLRPGAQPDRLDLLDPTRVRCEVDERSVRYWYRPKGGSEIELFASELVHWRGLSFDGVRGLAPIQYAKQTFGLALAAEKYGQRFFGNNAHPGGVLSTKQTLDAEQRDRVKVSIEEGHRGSNQMRLMVLDGDWEYQTFGIPPEQAQFLGTRVKSDGDVCKIFRVPPWMVGVQVEGSKPYANVEQEAINFVTYSIRPWLVRIEQGLNLSLFPRESNGRRDFFVEFLADAILRGDLKSRYDAYSVSFNRWRTRNEIRRLDNLNPVEGGDEFNDALTVQPAAAKAEQ